MRILLVEDHARLAEFIRLGLEAADFDVDAADHVDTACELLAYGHYDLVVLDLGLPDRNGLELLKTMRDKQDSTPVLIVTSRVQVTDRVEGLNAGADDYLTKPFALEELVARSHALLRRPCADLGRVLAAGNVTFDVVARDARVDEKIMPISPREARILEQLLRRNGKVVPKSLMEQSLYGIDEALSSNSVEVLVHRLRKKLSDTDADVAIHTVRGVGYMIMSEVP